MAKTKKQEQQTTQWDAGSVLKNNTQKEWKTKTVDQYGVRVKGTERQKTVNVGWNQQTSTQAPHQVYISRGNTGAKTGIGSHRGDGTKTNEQLYQEYLTQYTKMTGGKGKDLSTPNRIDDVDDEDRGYYEEWMGTGSMNWPTYRDMRREQDGKSVQGAMSYEDWLNNKLTAQEKVNPAKANSSKKTATSNPYMSITGMVDAADPLNRYTNENGPLVGERNDALNRDIDENGELIREKKTLPYHEAGPRSAPVSYFRSNNTTDAEQPQSESENRRWDFTTGTWESTDDKNTMNDLWNLYVSQMTDSSTSAWDMTAEQVQAKRDELEKSDAVKMKKVMALKDYDYIRNAAVSFDGDMNSFTEAVGQQVDLQKMVDECGLSSVDELMEYILADEDERDQMVYAYDAQMNEIRQRLSLDDYESNLTAEMTSDKTESVDISDLVNSGDFVYQLKTGQLGSDEDIENEMINGHQYDYLLDAVSNRTGITDRAQLAAMVLGAARGGRTKYEGKTEKSDPTLQEYRGSRAEGQDAESYLNQLSETGQFNNNWSFMYHAVNNPDMIGTMNGVAQNTMDSGIQQVPEWVKYMTDSERSMFNYLYNTGDINRLNEFYNAMADRLLYYQAEDERSQTMEYLGKSGLGVQALAWMGILAADTYNSLVSPLIALSALTGDKYGAYYYGQGARYVENTESAQIAALEKSLGDSWATKPLPGFNQSFAGLLYSSLTSAAISAKNAALGQGIAGAAGLSSMVGTGRFAQNAEALITDIIMSSGAFGTSMYDGIMEGKEPMFAMRDALADGLIESVTEIFSIEAFFETKNARGLMNGLISCAKTMGFEASEEFAGDWLKNAYSTIVRNEDGFRSQVLAKVREYKTGGMSAHEAEDRAVKEVLADWAVASMYSGLSGAISGGASGAVALIEGNAERAFSQIQGVKNVSNAGTTEQLLSLIESLPDASLSKDAARLHEAIYGKQTSNETETTSATEASAKTETKTTEGVGLSGLVSETEAANTTEAEAAPEKGTASEANAPKRGGKLNTAQIIRLARLSARAQNVIGEAGESAITGSMRGQLEQTMVDNGATQEEAASVSGQVYDALKSLVNGEELTNAQVEAISKVKQAVEIIANYEESTNEQDREAKNEAVMQMADNAEATAESILAKGAAIGGYLNGKSEETVKAAVASIFPDEKLKQDRADRTVGGKQQDPNSYSSSMDVVYDGRDYEIVRAKQTTGTNDEGEQYNGMELTIRDAEGNTQTVSLDDADMLFKETGTLALLEYAEAVAEDLGYADLSATEDGSIPSTKLNTFLNMYSGGSIAKYAEAFEAMYNAGFDGNVQANLEKAKKLGMDEKTADTIFHEGKRAGIQAENERVKSMKKSAQRKNGTVVMQDADGNVIATESMDAKQTQLYRTIEGIANVTPVNFVLTSGKVVSVDENGYGVLSGEQGSYNASTNTITLDMTSGASYYRDGVYYVKSYNNEYVPVTQFAVGKVAGHELTHFIEANSKENYAKLRDYVRNRMGEDAWNKRVAQKANHYGANGVRLTRAGAESEVIADACSNMLYDSKAIEELSRRNKSLGEMIREFLRNFVDKIRELMDVNARNTVEADMVRDNASDGVRFYTNEMAKLWDAGFVEAATRVVEASAAVEATSEADSTHLGAKQSSIRQFAEATDYKVKVNANGYAYAIVDKNGKEVTNVTPAMIESTPMGTLIDAAVANKTIDIFTAQEQRKMFADLMNLVIKYKDEGFVWEMAGANMFSAMKDNSDKQYGTTIDFGTICSKTQAVVDELSRVMVAKGRGLTRQEVMDVYWGTAHSKQSVPCPVCYVFSRWMGVPSLLETMRKGQLRFDRSTSSAKLNEYVHRMENTYKSENADKPGDGVGKAKTKLQNKLNSLNDKLQKTGVIKGESILAEMDKLQRQLDDIELYNWVIQVYCATDKSGKQALRDKDGNVHMDPNYSPVPCETGNNVLLDLNRTGEFARDYPKAWKYRTTRGAGMGKAILPYSGASIGDSVKGTKTRYEQSKNPFLKKDAKAASKAITNAMKRAKRQNLIGGQRFQSTSDFRAEWGIDYMMTFLEMQAIGSKVQLYTKVIEAVDMLASSGAEVNLSIMGKGKGWHTDANGNKVLDFSSVTGIDFDQAYDKVQKYDNVQMILVGLNDDHIRLAMNDDRIGFIIPWHSSGSNQQVLGNMLEALNEKLDTSGAHNYEDTQSDDTTNATALWGIRKRLLTGKLTAEDKAVIKNSDWLNSLYNRFYLKAGQTDLRDKKVASTDNDTFGVKLTSKQADQIFPYEYWDTTLTMDEADTNGERFVQYCEHMGVVPRFSQFAGEHGYWKLLIDRRMYNRNGTYHNPQVIDVTNIKQSDIPMSVDSAVYGKHATQEQKNAAFNEAMDRISAREQKAYDFEAEADEETQLSIRDQEYLDAVKSGDLRKQRIMVEQAAIDAGAAVGENGRPIRLYHGTPRSFGFTEFRKDRVIFTSTSESIAHGYADFGNTKQAKSFVEYDGTLQNLVQNAKNVIGSDIKILDSNEKKRIHDKLISEIKPVAQKITDLTNQMQNGAPSEIQNEFWDVALILNSVLENDADFFDEDPTSAEWREGFIERFFSDFTDIEEKKNKVREWYSQHENEVEDEATKNAFEYMMSYEFGDAIIDEQHSYRRLLQNGDNFVRPNGSIITKDQLMDWIDLQRGKGTYKLFGFPGDNPLIVDAQKSYWTNISVPVIGEGTYSTDYIVKWANKNGYTSVIIKNVMDPSIVNDYGDDYVFFNSNQVKQAGNVQYDDAGNVIPLSERFDHGNEDIRYSISSQYDPQTAHIKQQIKHNIDEINKIGVVAKVIANNNMLATRQATKKWAKLLIGGKTYFIKRQNFGIVDISYSKLKRAISYTKNPAQKAAIAAVPSVIQKGLLITERQEHKHRNHGTYTFAAQVSINGVVGDMGVVVSRTEGIHYKTHRILMPDGSSFEFVNNKNEEPTTTMQGASITGPLAAYISSPFKNTISQDADDGNAQSGETEDKLSLASEYSESIYDAYEMLNSVGESMITTGEQKGAFDNYKRAYEEYVRLQKEVTELGSTLQSLITKRVAGDITEARNRLDILKGQMDRAYEKLRKASNNAAVRNMMTRADNAVRKFVMEDDDLSRPIEDIVNDLKEQLKLTKAADTKKLIDWVNAYKKAEKEHKEKLKSDREYRKQMEKNQKHKNVIARRIKALNELRVNEQDYKNVPQDLKPLVDKVVAAFAQHDTVGGPKLVFSKDDAAKLLVKYTKIADVDIPQGYAFDEDTRALLDAMDEMFYGLSAISNSPNGTFSLKERADANGRILESLAVLADHVYNIVRTARNDFRIGQSNTVAEMGSRIIRDLSGKQNKKIFGVDKNGELTKAGKNFRAVAKFVGWGNMTPEYFFRHLGNKTMSQLNDGLHNGENEYGLQLKIAYDRFAEIAKKYNRNKWDDEKRLTLTTKQGRTIRLTTQQALSVYATWKREHQGIITSNHLENGGIVLASVVGVDQKGQRILPEDMKLINDFLTDEQKAYADEMVRFLSNDMSELGNKTSMELFGIKKYTETYYFPIASSRATMFHKSIDANVYTSDDSRIKHPGFSKSRINNAQNAVIIDDFDKIVMTHTGQMVTYSSFAVPIEMMNRVLNYAYDTDEEISSRGTVRSLIMEKYGPDAGNYLQQYLHDLNGGAVNKGSDFGDKLLSMMKKNAVAGSLSVALQQPLSYIRAMYCIDPKYLIAAVGANHGKQNHEEMMKWSGVAVIKQMGKLDMGTGLSAVEWLGGSRELKKKFAEKAADVMTFAAEKADQLTWNRMWAAAKLEVADKNKSLTVGSDAYFQAVAERFNEVMRLTQVYDSTLVRSQNMRDKGMFMKGVTSFMAEPTVTMNMLTDAFRKGNKTNAQWAEGVTKATAAYIISAIMQAVIKGLMGAGRSDDDKRTWLEQFTEKFHNAATNEIIPLNLIPGFDEFRTAMGGDTPDDNTWSSVSSAWKSIGTFIKAFSAPDETFGSVESVYKWIENGIGQMAQLKTDLPVRNVLRDVRALFNLSSNASGSESILGGNAVRDTSSAVVSYSALKGVMSDDLVSMLNDTFRIYDMSKGTEDGMYSLLYRYLKAGDTKNAQKVYDYLVLTSTAQDPHKTIVKGIKDWNTKYYKGRNIDSVVSRVPTKTTVKTK